MQQIPLDNEILRFRNHLDITPRVIFSAKFGDGKIVEYGEVLKVDYILDKSRQVEQLRNTE